MMNSHNSNNPICVTISGAITNLDVLLSSPKSALLVDGTTLDKVNTQVGIFKDVENIADIEIKKDTPLYHVSKDGNTHHSTTSMKSVSILRTQWGDLVDEERDISDEQEQNLEGDLDKGSSFTPFMSRRHKKYNKKKDVDKLNDKGVQSTSSEHIQTHSKKSVIYQRQS